MLIQGVPFLPLFPVSLCYISHLQLYTEWILCICVGSRVHWWNMRHNQQKSSAHQNTSNSTNFSESDSQRLYTILTPLS